jgi:hypothetical protein
MYLCPVIRIIMVVSYPAPDKGQTHLIMHMEEMISGFHSRVPLIVGKGCEAAGSLKINRKW